MTTINDPVFGPLEFDGYTWQGQTGLLLLGEALRLGMEGTPQQPPGDLERVAYQHFLALHASVQPTLEKAMFAYYLEVAPIYRDAMGDLADQLMPLFSDSSLIWKALSYPSVYVPLQDAGPETRADAGPETGWTYEYHFESEWDVEHGLRVIVRDGPVFGVDMQSGASWEYITHYDALGNRL
jgi:hypothetical protein